MKLLTFDPGKHNFAFSIMKDGVITTHGYVDTLYDLSVDNLHDAQDAFVHSVRSIIESAGLNPARDWVVAERFLHRPGRGRGGVGERINLMLGMLLNVARYEYGLEAYIITPAVWKNYMNRNYEMPKKGGMLSVLGKPEGLTDHEADAIGIACYEYELQTGEACVKSCLNTHS